MKPALFTAAALAAVAAMPAQATTYTLPQDLVSLGGYSFASQAGANAHLDDTFRFTVGTAPVDFGGLLASSFRVSAGAIGNLVAELTGGGITRTFDLVTLAGNRIGVQLGWIETVLPASGLYSIHVTGDAGAAGAAYSLDIAAAVPEPSEWTMMIAGLGVVGMIARRRRLMV